MNTFTLSMAFLMGLTGSLHCAGMCGPIIWIMPFNMMHGLRKRVALALYHLGRVSIYAGMALLLYGFKGLFQPQWQQYISIILGVTFLVIGILAFIPGHSLNIAGAWTEPVKKMLGKFIGNPSLPALFISGALNGMLPCGLVYMALSASMAASDAIHAVSLMYAFGLGTMPALVALTVLRNKANFLRTGNARKLVPVVMFVFGSLFVMRGMNLGIPYLSPKISIEHNTVKASCCHKKIVSSQRKH